MEMSRRGCGGAVAAAVAVPMATVTAPPGLEIIRPATDVDLSVCGLLYAISAVGHGPYTLRVPPESRGLARAVLSAAFGPDDSRYRDFTISIERLDEYIDSWALDNGRRRFYTIGV